MNPEDVIKRTSRRQLLDGLSVGFGAAQTAPVLAQQTSAPANRVQTPTQTHRTSLLNETPLLNM